MNFVDLWGLCGSDLNLAGVPTQYRAALIEQYNKTHSKGTGNQKEIIYTADNPINQNDFDKRYGFSSPDEKSQSCKTNSLINLYAKDGGVKQSQLDVAVEKWKNSGAIYDDGSPHDLNVMSNILAKEMGENDYLIQK